MGSGHGREDVDVELDCGRQRNPAVRPGFKLFFNEDREEGALMTPARALALTPRPDYIMYE